MPGGALVLWDIDRTLLYVGETDRRVYREAFERVVGRPVERLPARGTGVTMPLAVRQLLRENGVPEPEVEALAERVIRLLPELLAARRVEMREGGRLMDGAVAALQAVRQTAGLVPTVLTGNLRANAEIKLQAFELSSYLESSIGAFSSDDSHRPALVAVAQRRAGLKHRTAFTRANTVIIGDSLEDIRTGLQGGARVIGVASGTADAQDLEDAGADAVLTDLTDAQVLLATIARLVS
ncbi:haloacid dehalogenase-like hydrolase [Kitasatospora sp. NBC_01287]|uniref:HAD family hydrolase n=1 Tax=Kitasatospora sp. NBC_01287 TaxID=2903573 RepID=UPI0022550417|nr:haloacid dehalogenase-like hydrolase [Kitasatospora sp. NBC_01287]MCX4750566.1 haloacid dehalogenase-like hydrolase [Kitasatospora sp. NBC_01287]